MLRKIIGTPRQLEENWVDYIRRATQVAKTCAAMYGEDSPHVEDAAVGGVYALEESEESATDTGVLEHDIRRSFVRRPAVGGSGVALGSSASKCSTEETVVDLMPDHSLPASVVVGAEFDLDVECGKSCQVPCSLGAFLWGHPLGSIPSGRECPRDTTHNPMAARPAGVKPCSESATRAKLVDRKRPP